MHQQIESAVADAGTAATAANAATELPRLLRQRRATPARAMPVRWRHGRARATVDAPVPTPGAAAAGRAAETAARRKPTPVTSPGRQGA